MNYSLHITPLKDSSQQELADVSRLHAKLLPHSPIALLGPRFMEKYYYRILPRENLICGAVAYVENKPAGFIVATDNSSGFMPTALRRHWAYLVYLLGSSVLRQPNQIGALWEAWQIMKCLNSTEDTNAMGEMLSFGVSRPYRKSSFIKASGLNVAETLFEYALKELENEKVNAIRAVVDEDNIEAKFFYHRHGWKLQPGNVPGWRVPSIEFVWNF